MLKWECLLNTRRRDELHGSNRTMNTRGGRVELERDYDRILFATPIRRLADKTQVFPMEENDAIRTRLTHSYEVSNLARSIGIQIAFEHASAVFGEDHDRLQVKRNVPAILAAVGLAHDLGNPPFGHQGEVAIKEWFNENRKDISPHNDLLHFDGNPQTFRLLTRLQVLDDEFGFNLTVATLAALLKYPSFFESPRKGGFKKYGVFESERQIAHEVWKETGLEEGRRHPFAYIMEACDDIIYSVIDAEDTVKKGYASFYDLMDYLESTSGDDSTTMCAVNESRIKNKEFKEQLLSSRELNDISMQMFRAKSISLMVTAATSTFVDNVGKMVSGNISDGFEVIGKSCAGILCNALKEFDRRYGFVHSDVLRLELEGNNYIKGIMNLLWCSISKRKEDRNAFERYAYGRISENYRRVFESSRKTSEDGQRLLCDAVSGMTENFLVSMYHELRELSDGPK